MLPAMSDGTTPGIGLLDGARWRLPNDAVNKLRHPHGQICRSAPIVVGLGKRLRSCDERPNRGRETKRIPQIKLAVARNAGNGICGSCIPTAAWLLASQDELAGSYAGLCLSGLSGMWCEEAI